MRIIKNTFILLVLCLFPYLSAMGGTQKNNPASDTGSETVAQTNDAESIKRLSEKMWRLMSEKDSEQLQELFHDAAMFTHMGGSWGKENELEIIRNGYIWYKKADIHSVDVKFAANTAILYSDMHLTAVVGDTHMTVVNHFITTEVFVFDKGQWQLASLAFTKLVEPSK